MSKANENIESAFPGLRKAGAYRITSDATPNYNCVGWAAGRTDQFWWPVGSYYWPPNITRAVNVESFTQAFATLGFLACDSNELEDGVEKVAIYLGNDGKPTHMSWQLASGSWSSKLGSGNDIRHKSIDGVEGDRYGKASVILSRPRQRSTE